MDLVTPDSHAIKSGEMDREDIQGGARAGARGVGKGPTASKGFDPRTWRVNARHVVQAMEDEGSCVLSLQAEDSLSMGETLGARAGCVLLNSGGE
jgi:hypothetical protein